MLSDIKKTLKEHYYDKNYHGIDLDTRFKEAEKRINTYEFNAQIFREIAMLVMEFDDSHTRFIPPSRANRVEYGFTLQMIGDKCFVVQVKNGSDAEKQGITPGDQILSIGTAKVVPTRDSLWKINYLIYQLDPRESLLVTLRDMSGIERSVTVAASFKTQNERREEAERNRKKRLEDPYKCIPINNGVIACRLESFSIEQKYIDRMMDDASKHQKLILDLRGNRGGYVKVMQRLIGYFFDREIPIGTMVMRNKSLERSAKPVKGKIFNGNIIVLTDSNSGSASEVFARVMQIQKRGTIVGDVSAGAVMTSYLISMTNARGVPGMETLSGFALNVTISDLIMSDGSRLEKVGVIPDHLVGPSPAALSGKNDPVLAYSASLFGASLSSEKAATFNFRIKNIEEDADKEEDGEN